MGRFMIGSKPSYNNVLLLVKLHGGCRLVVCMLTKPFLFSFAKIMMVLYF